MAIRARIVQSTAVIARYRTRAVRSEQMADETCFVSGFRVRSRRGRTRVRQVASEARLICPRRVIEWDAVVGWTLVAGQAIGFADEIVWDRVCLRLRWQ